MYRLKQSHLMVYIVTAFFSVMLSFWISSTSLVMNTDGICYLQSAETFLELGFHSAVQLCDQSKWPFYSILIATFVNITSLSYINAAYVLNGLFSLLTTVVFIGIVQYLSRFNPIYTNVNKRSLLWVAAIVILLSNELNSIKHSIIRDHGFWAFYLLSILFLLHFLQTRLFRYAVGWSLSLIVATLFRIEGAIFLIFMPFTVWFDLKQHFFRSLKAYLQLNTCLGIGLFLFFIWLLFYPEQSLGRLDELLFQFSHGFNTLIHRFNIRAEYLGAKILNVYSLRDVKLIFFLTLIIWYVTKVVANVSGVYFFLLLYAWWKKCLVVPRSAILVLFGYILINIAITGVFLFQNMFLSKRYLIALSLVFMLWVPFALEYLISQWQKLKWHIGVVFLCIMASSLGGIFEYGHSKKYIYDAGHWLSQNSHRNSQIYSNDGLIMYYSQHFGHNIFNKIKIFKDVRTLKNGKWKEYDYLAMRLDKKDPKKMSMMLAEIPYQPIKIFQNKRGDQVRIYQVHHE